MVLNPLVFHWWNISIETIGTISTNGITFILLVKCISLWGLRGHYYWLASVRLSGGASSLACPLVMIGTIGTNGIIFIPLVLHWWNASHYGDRIFRLASVRLSGGTWYQWNNIYFIGEMHFIIGTYNISIGFRPSGGAFYSSIGRIGMISTNGKTFIPLVKCISLHSGTYASHYREYFRWLQATWGGASYLPIGTIGTNRITFIPLELHWWNASHYGDSLSGQVGVHFTCPLVRSVQLVPIK